MREISFKLSGRLTPVSGRLPGIPGDLGQSPGNSGRLGTLAEKRCCPIQAHCCQLKCSSVLSLLRCGCQDSTLLPTEVFISSATVEMWPTAPRGLAVAVTARSQEGRRSLRALRPCHCGPAAACDPSPSTLGVCRCRPMALPPAASSTS